MTFQPSSKRSPDEACVIRVRIRLFPDSASAASGLRGVAVARCMRHANLARMKLAQSGVEDTACSKIPLLLHPGYRDVHRQVQETFKRSPDEASVIRVGIRLFPDSASAASGLRGVAVARCMRHANLARMKLAQSGVEDTACSKVPLLLHPGYRDVHRQVQETFKRSPDEACVIRVGIRLFPDSASAASGLRGVAVARRMRHANLARMAPAPSGRNAQRAGDAE